MISNLPEELIILIMKKLYNYDIFSLNQVCRNYNKIINTDNFILHLQTRYHPLVFDSWDTYCQFCNIHIYKIDESIIKNCIWCKH